MSNRAVAAARKRLKTGAVRVEAQDLWLADADNLEAKLVLELATEIERAKNPEYCSVSYASQEEAAAYFNSHGFAVTLDRLTTMQGS